MIRLSLLCLLIVSILAKTEIHFHYHFDGVKKQRRVLRKRAQHAHHKGWWDVFKCYFWIPLDRTKREECIAWARENTPPDYSDDELDEDDNKFNQDQDEQDQTSNQTNDHPARNPVVLHPR